MKAVTNLLPLVIENKIYYNKDDFTYRTSNCNTFSNRCNNPLSDLKYHKRKKFALFTTNTNTFSNNNLTTECVNEAFLTKSLNNKAKLTEKINKITEEYKENNNSLRKNTLPSIKINNINRENN